MRKQKVETQAIDKTDIDEVLGYARTKVDEDLRSELLQYVEKVIIETESRMKASFIETNGRLLKTGIDNVALRTQTVHLLLNEFRSAIEENSKFENVLYLAGLNVGRSFFDDFWNFQLRENIIPRTYDVLLSFWARYDSSAGFGQFELSEETEITPTITLFIKNSFLTRGLLGFESTIHPFCSFMLGYVRSYRKLSFCASSLAQRQWLPAT